MSADIETRVRQALAAVAESRTPTADWDDVRARAAAASDPAHRRWPLMAAAAALIAIAVVTYATLASGPSPRRIDVRPADDTVGVTTTTLDPRTGISLDVAWDSVPEWGLLIRDGKGAAHVISADGSATELADALAPEFSTTPGENGPITGTGAELSVIAVPNGSTNVSLLARETASGAAPAGCNQPLGYGLAPSAAGPNASYSVCGADAREIWRTEAYQPTTFSGPPTWPAMATNGSGQMAGHWRNVAPSPDGTFVAAQWSGECESPMAFIAPAEGALAPLLAEADGRLPETIHHGWTPDGRLILEVPVAGCGTSASMAPGVYLMSMTGAEPQIISGLLGDAGDWKVWVWRKAG